MMMMTILMTLITVTKDYDDDDGNKDDVGNGIAPVVHPCYTNQSHALNLVKLFLVDFCLLGLRRQKLHDCKESMTTKYSCFQVGGFNSQS